MRLKFGGRGASFRVSSATKSPSSWIAGETVEAALEADRRPRLLAHAGTAAERAADVSRPDLREVLELEQSPNRAVEIARTSSGSTARSGRARSPTKSESPVITSHGAPERDSSSTTNAMWSGRWPGVARAAMRTPATCTASPSASGSCSNSTAARSETWMVAPVADRRRPRPETWSACVCVSRMCVIWKLCSPPGPGSPRPPTSDR